MYLRTFDGGLKVDEVMWPDVLRWRSLHNLEIAQSSKFHSEILQCFGSLVDEENVEDDIKLMHLESIVSTITLSKSMGILPSHRLPHRQGRRNL